MANPNPISNFELMVMLALVHLGDEAYGVPITEKIEAHSGHDVAVGSVYAALERLQSRALVASRVVCSRGFVRHRQERRIIFLTTVI